MESAVAVNIFSRSVETYGIRYLKYFGDGDSSSFNAIKNIYPGVLSQKYKFLGHYQKRVGNRLRKLRQRVKGLGGKSKVKEVIKTTADGKITKTKQTPRGKIITDNVINILQNYFGIALRSGAKTVAELKNKLLASFFHIASSEEFNYHAYCPATSDSWCQYQRDQINGTNLYKHGKGFDPDVLKHVKPEYMKLTADSELAKCLHGQTQNANESLNSLICGLTKLKLCVYDAISYFNYGAQSILDTLKLLSIDAGNYTIKSAVDANIPRRYNAGYKAKPSSMKRRKVIRGEKRKKSDKIKKREGVTYESGGFY